jgi:hypothetical protein
LEPHGDVRAEPLRATEEVLVRLKNLVVIAALAAFGVLALASTSGAAGGKLKCFADAPATCVLNSTTSATLDTTSGSDAGVFLSNGKNTNGTPLAGADFSFSYFCANTLDTTSCIAGGAPRWSIPISTDGINKTTEAYAFLDAQGCINGGETPSGGAITVSTALAQCPVDLNISGHWANWDAFAAANTTYRISGDLPFVIADVQTGGQIVVSDVLVTKS